MANVGIIGAGGWGLALANIFSEKHNIKVWVHSEESYKLLNSSHQNDNYLKNIKLNEDINFTMDIGEAVNDSEIVIIVTPSFAFSEACTNIEPYISNEQILVSATKGLDRNTGKTMRIRSALKNAVPQTEFSPKLLSSIAEAIKLYSGGEVGIILINGSEIRR